MTSDELLQVLSACKGQSSGWGVSYYMTRCARKARLDREAKESGEAGESSFTAQVGTLFHKLEELYYTDQLGGIALPIDDDADCDKDAVQEALRVFAGYLAVFSKDEFTSVGCEVLLPRNDAEKILIETAVNVSPFTLRIDQIVHVTELQAQGMKTRRRVELEPGYYLKDTKTAKQKNSNATLDYELSVQFPAYIMAWNAVHPDQQVKGLLVNNVIRHADLTKKEPDGAWRSFRTFVVPPPSEVVIQAVRKFLPRKAEYLKTDECDLAACSDWNGCPHYTNGNCNRI